jgi:hypothetical protein
MHDNRRLKPIAVAPDAKWMMVRAKWCIARYLAGFWFQRTETNSLTQRIERPNELGKAIAHLGNALP